MQTLSEIVKQAAADLTAARNNYNELNALFAAPVGTPAQEAATNARIAELKKALRNR